jgi:hypothetical protein
MSNAWDSMGHRELIGPSRQSLNKMGGAATEISLTEKRLVLFKMSGSRKIQNSNYLRVPVSPSRSDSFRFSSSRDSIRFVRF